jgi:Domain of unknown function (DUF4268)
MAEKCVGKLERVPLREVWEHEGYDFTRWLEQNVDVLSGSLGFGLANAEREQAAGAFSIDLVAEDDAGQKVIIENQLEKSNHDHLGKVITYMVAMGAKTAVWIVAEPRPEHVAAVAWLNDSSDAGVYLVKVEAVRIGGSPPAPLLTLIVGPSVESEAVSKSKKQFAARYDERQDWWKRFIARPEAKLHRHITPSSYSWIGTSSRVRGLNLNGVVWQDECASELYIDRGDEAENKSIFDQLETHRADIESKFGGPLLWERLDGRRASRIRITLPGGYRSPQVEWDEIQLRQVDAMNRLNAALQPYLKTLILAS